MINDSKTTETALQEISDCRAESIGMSGFAECLCQGPNSCPYALPFGYAFLCQHPRLDAIIQATKKDRATRTKTN